VLWWLASIANEFWELFPHYSQGYFQIRQPRRVIGLQSRLVLAHNHQLNILDAKAPASFGGSQFGFCHGSFHPRLGLLTLRFAAMWAASFVDLDSAWFAIPRSQRHGLDDPFPLRQKAIGHRILRDCLRTA
jgi:hypothetical protein